jgi:hypothetical protein
MPVGECWEALAALKCAYCWFEVFELLIKALIPSQSGLLCADISGFGVLPNTVCQLGDCWEALAALKCAYCRLELFELLIKLPSRPSRRCFEVVPAALVHRKAQYAHE